MSDSRKWWAVNRYKKVGPFSSRESAASAWFHAYPESKAKDVMTGYGSEGPYFDIQWIKRSDHELHDRSVLFQLRNR